MCVVSNVGDHFNQRFQPYINPQYPDTHQLPGGAGGGMGFPQGGSLADILKPTISRQEFDDLKKEVQEMKRLLINAKEIDEKTNQPNCEQEEKLKILRAVADAVGISLDDVLPRSK